MSTHEARHEEWLLVLLTAEGQGENEELRRQLQDCPECRVRLQEFRDLELELGGVKQEATALSAAAGSVGSGSGEPEERAVAGFRRQIQQHDQKSPARRWRLLWPALAAAAGLLLALYLRPWEAAAPSSTDPPSQGTQPGTLGSDQLQCLSPLGTVPAYGLFEWRWEQAGEVTFDLRVYDLEGNALFKRTDLLEPRWTPSVQVVASWPDSVEWEIVARDLSGTEVGVASARCSLLP